MMKEKINVNLKENTYIKDGENIQIPGNLMDRGHVYILQISLVAKEKGVRI